ncbi:isopenicillin N synthase family dioxygenase [Microbacterium kunmingense]|uniref:isopenicillin N synthase family dioxygenase n=1 Tax=Microbacterium kunmingense TaxID=2915939 RepID=UPI0020029A06|nr:2-oxoglutarate and iron-dependent oxygenase domain-containing protein [Microbacterium kunmingense]
MTTQDTLNLPLLHLADFSEDETSPAAERFVEQLRTTCHEVGFFYLVGHGVPTQLNDDLQRVSKEFFSQPVEERMAIAMDNSPHFRGYTPFKGEQTNGQSDLRDEIDFGPERAAVPNSTVPYERLIGPNQFPDSVPELRSVVLAWQREMDRLGRTVLRAVARALGQDPAILEDWVSPHAEDTIKLVRYAAPTEEDNSNQGVGRHRDFGILTFVLQDEVGGLEVEREGDLVSAVPVPGAFVVNLGEMLQLLTHGYFKATVHRVVSPPTGIERYSCIYFFNPRLDATLSPLNLPTALQRNAPGGESDDASNPILATYGENILKVRLRAHPTTARAHHADLLQESPA